jgi:hypothetical protein
MSNGYHKSTFGDILIGFLSFFLAFPIFILIHKQIPDPDWSFNIDRILLFISIILVCVIVLRLFKFVVVLAVVVAVAWLSYGSLMKKYGFENLFRDYRGIAYSIKDDPTLAGIIFSNHSSFPNRSLFMNAIDDHNPVVRSFAVAATNEYFKAEQQKYHEYHTLIQCFAIFKKINSNWNYVNDSRSREYLAKASESVKLLAGDCDDHSILIAACLQAVGAAPRLIYTTGHVYPEILVGNKHDLEQVNFLIKKRLFTVESAKQNIYYHEDEQGRIWLNLDYTAKYPGGPFMSEKVLAVLPL